MKIAFVSQPWNRVVPPVQAGSLAIWTYQIARRLARSHQVTVYSRRAPGDERLQQHEGVEYRRFGLLADRCLRKLLEGFSRFRSPERPTFASPLYYPRYIRQVAADIRARQCDLVHIFNFSQFVPVVRAFNPGARIVLHMQCEWLTQLDRKMIARRLEGADAIIGCSRCITDAIRARFADFAGPCETIFNGVDPERFSGRAGKPDSEDKRERRLLFVGRVSPEKGVHVLLDALRIVADRFIQARLDVVGPIGECERDFVVALCDDERVAQLASFYDGRGYGSHLKEQWESLGLQDRVTWHGAVPHRNLPAHYRGADVLINPSLSEPFGITVIEAMASETPVVASRVGGMIETVVDGKTGLLVEAGDAKALAEAICRLLSDAELCRSMGKAGRERVMRYFSWDRIAEGLLRLCERTMGLGS